MSIGSETISNGLLTFFLKRWYLKATALVGVEYPVVKDEEEK